MTILSDSEWLVLFKEYENSTHDFKSFCKMHDIGCSTFCEKKRELINNSKNHSDSICFNEVSIVVPDDKNDLTFDINGISLSFNSSTSDDSIKRILKIVLSL